ncbi:MAG: hypothetical protein KAJ24_04870 [Candidatus Aenigmarchaeota archaeon]|nr:hypothetical protein [Candidatus Aenigmarchaeota archaeon]
MNEEPDIVEFIIHRKPMTLKERKKHMAERGNWREVKRINSQIEWNKEKRRMRK